MGNDRSAAKRPTRTPAEEALRARADEFHKGGMPFQMAMAVAHGRMTLSDALERMSRKDRVTRLVEDQGLSRALATQVAMGHVELKTILRRRRLKEHRELNRDRTMLEVGNRLTFGLHGKRVLSGTVKATAPYSITVELDSGEEEEIHKLQIKFVYVPTDWKRAKKAIKTDKALSKAPRDPVPRPQDRYGCSDKRVFTFIDRGDEIAITTLEGEVIRGKPVWFSRYEIAVEVRGDATIYVFRHALHNVSTI